MNNHSPSPSLAPSPSHSTHDHVHGYESDSDGGSRSGNNHAIAEVADMVKEEVESMWEKNIPVPEVAELYDFRWKSVLGTFTICAGLAIFFYFVVTSKSTTSTCIFRRWLIIVIYSAYQSSRQSPFISLQADAGECQVIPRGVTATHVATVNGLWDNDASFQSSKALYLFKFQNFVGTPAHFGEIVKSIKDAFSLGSLYGTLMAKQSLATNLILLQTLVLNVTLYGSISIFQFLARPGIIYHRNTLSYMTFTTPNVSQCLYSSHMFMSKDTSLASINIDVDSAESAEYNCSLLSVFDNLGYSEFFDGSEFNLDVDFQSFVVAVSVNYGFRSLSLLNELEGLLDIPESAILNDGVEYEMKRYVDGNYLGMDPILCISRANDGFFVVCGVLIGSVFAVPVSNSWGGPNVNTEPDVCHWYDSRLV
jgi:hypothetical protein